MGNKCSHCDCECGLCASGNAAGIQACRTVGCATCGCGPKALQQGGAIANFLGGVPVVSQIITQGMKNQGRLSDAKENELHFNQTWISAAKTLFGGLAVNVAWNEIVEAAPHYQELLDLLYYGSSGFSRDDLKADMYDALCKRGAGVNLAQAMAQTAGGGTDDFLRQALRTFSTEWKTGSKAGVLAALRQTSKHERKQTQTPMSSSLLSLITTLGQQAASLPGNCELKDSLRSDYFDLGEALLHLLEHHKRSSSIHFALPRSVKAIVDEYTAGGTQNPIDGELLPKKVTSLVIKMMRGMPQNDLFRTRVRVSSNRMADLMRQLQAAVTKLKKNGGFDFMFKLCVNPPKSYADIKLYMRYAASDGNDIVVELQIIEKQLAAADDTHGAMEQNRMYEMMNNMATVLQDSVAGSELYTDLAFNLTGNIMCAFASIV